MSENLRGRFGLALRNVLRHRFRTAATLAAISIGVAERDPERRTSSAVVDAADKALYRSKQRGRNRLTLAGAARGS